MFKTALSVLLGYFILFSTVLSDTIHVPADFPFIQTGIDAAEDGDTVFVAPGTYREQIDFLGKAIIVKSLDGPATTVIDGRLPPDPDHASVVTFRSGEENDSVLDGFSIVNGSGTYGNYLGNVWCHGGGGIYCEGASPTIRNNRIQRNQVNGLGGGIFTFNQAAPVITHNLITENGAHQWLAGIGGAIFMAYNPAVVITDNQIVGNYALVSGGAIDCRRESSGIIRNNLIAHNQSSWVGGGISRSENTFLPGLGHVTIEDNVISNNNGGEGGGLWFYHCNTLLRNNRIIRNRSGFGGGIYLQTMMDTDTVILGNIIHGNAAKTRGGGIFGNGAGSPIVNNIISENHAEMGGGIYIDMSQEGPPITNNTIIGNRADFGGGFYCQADSQPIIANTIFRQNQAPVGKAIMLSTNTTPVGLLISHSNVEGGLASVQVDPGCTVTWGNGMIDASPGFVDDTINDFHLTYDSACRNAGDPTAMALPEFDMEGDPRIADGMTDIGADEFDAHLYATGEFKPGGIVTLKFVGTPGTLPVAWFIGSGVLEQPVPTMWGDFYLQAPWRMITLAPIPANGVLKLFKRVPGHSKKSAIPMQALIGDQLSNLFRLELR